MKRAVLSAAVISMAVVGVSVSSATDTGSSSLKVPAAGPKTVSVAWSGSLGPSTDLPNATGCNGTVDASQNETHKIAITVPANAYNVVKAKLAFIVDSQPTTVGGSYLNGDVIELLDPSGASVGTDQQKPEMEVDVTNPTPGTWTALICEFVPDDVGHPYKAQIVVKTKCRTGATCPAAVRKKK